MNKKRKNMNLNKKENTYLEMLMARGMLIEAKKKRGEIDYYGVHLQNSKK